MTNFNQSENIKKLISLCLKYNCYVCYVESSEYRNGNTLKIFIECINRPFYLRTDDFPLTLQTGSMDSPDWESIESAIVDFSLPYLFHQ